MSSKKIITVFGATGSQGGSVVAEFLKLPDWTVRAVTRDLNKPAAQKLASQGAEVVTADLNDHASLEKAVAGSAAVFGVTDYWATMDANKEIVQGKALADAVKAANVPHYIWSTLYDVAKLTNGKLSKVYHFDSKAAVADYIRELGIPATFFLPGCYAGNFVQSFRQLQGPEGPWTFAMPFPADSSELPIFDPRSDTGKFVKAIVLNRDTVLGKDIYGTSGYITANDILHAFQTAFPNAGKGAHYYQLPHDQYLSTLTGFGLPPFAAEELLENMRLMDKKDGGGYYGGASLDESLALLGDEKPITILDFFKSVPAFQALN